MNGKSYEQPTQFIDTFVAIDAEKRGNEDKPHYDEIIEWCLIRYGGRKADPDKHVRYATFKQPVKAVQFAINLQRHLHAESMPPLPPANVGIAIDVTSRITTSRTEAKDIARLLCSTASGGQIRMSLETYDVVNQHLPLLRFDKPIWYELGPSRTAHFVEVFWMDHHMRSRQEPGFQDKVTTGLWNLWYRLTRDPLDSRKLEPNAKALGTLRDRLSVASAPRCLEQRKDELSDLRKHLLRNRRSRLLVSGLALVLVGWLPAPLGHLLLSGLLLSVGSVAVLLGSRTTLQKRGSVLAVLHGGPGLGKSALALAAFHDNRVSRHYRRRFFIHCDGLKTIDEIHQRIADQLGLSPQTDLAKIEQALSVNRTLVVLDSLTNVLNADARGVEAYIHRLENVKGLGLLTTVGLHEPPVAISSQFHRRPTLLDAEAARKVFHYFSMRRLVATEQTRLDTLLKDMGGLPLAIELLGRVASHGYQDIDSLARDWKDRRTALLRDGQGPESLSLDASLELSLASISRDRQQEAIRLLKLLALLPDGIAKADLNESWNDQRDCVAILMDLGLLFGDQRGPEQTRVRFLSPVREFVRSKALIDPPHSDHQFRLAKHYLDLLVRLASELASRESGEARARLVPEASNIAEMIKLWLEFEIAGVGLADPDLLTVAMEAYGRFVRYTGFGSIQPLILAASHARDKSQDTGTIVADKEHIFLKIEADCYRLIGESALWRLGEGEEEPPSFWYNRALAGYGRIGNKPGQAHCKRGLADWAQQCPVPDLTRAAMYYWDALKLYDEAGDKKGQANCFLGLGELALRSQKLEEAEKLFEKAGASYQAVASREGLGNYYLALGDVQRALADRLLGQRQTSTTEGTEEKAETQNEKAKQNARAHYHQARRHFEAVDEAYSLGLVHAKLAEMCRTKAERRSHVKIGTEKWRLVNREDLVDGLKARFPEA